MALDIRIRFGRAIRRVREEQGINQEEAAERAGCIGRITAASNAASGTCRW
jgi:transcriptional regulator with XRE-family HTH domain